MLYAVWFVLGMIVTILIEIIACIMVAMSEDDRGGKK
jgi:hypothetical protein